MEKRKAIAPTSILDIPEHVAQATKEAESLRCVWVSSLTAMPTALMSAKVSARTEMKNALHAVKGGLPDNKSWEDSMPGGKLTWPRFRAHVNANLGKSEGCAQSPDLLNSFIEAHRAEMLYVCSHSKVLDY